MEIGCKASLGIKQLSHGWLSYGNTVMTPHFESRLIMISSIA